MSSAAFAGLSPCVHCGFCLQSCPTFLVTGDESDSPRGRIVLMRAVAHGELPAADRALIFHLDRCLGCRGCEPVCPSGVSYAPALEEVRRLIAERRSPDRSARTVLAVLATPVVRRAALAAARLLRPLASGLAGSGRLGFAFGMLAATRTSLPLNGKARRGRAETLPARPPTSAPSRGRATVFRGCIMDGLFGHVHEATARTLRANGYEVVETGGQGCCGALHAHAGLHEEAAALARANVAAFASLTAGAIVVNSAGCGALLKEYPRLLAGDPAGAADAARVAERVMDVSEALAAAGPRQGAPLDVRVAYDPPCHLLHAQRVAEAPLAVLHAIPGVRLVPHAEADLCCGSAGTYSLTEPELSRAVLARKVEAIGQARPDVVASGNPGCIMQLGAGLAAAGLDIPVVHPVELLDRSYAKAGYYES